MNWLMIILCFLIAMTIWKAEFVAAFLYVVIMSIYYTIKGFVITGRWAWRKYKTHHSPVVIDKEWKKVNEDIDSFLGGS